MDIIILYASILVPQHAQFTGKFIDKTESCLEWHLNWTSQVAQMVKHLPGVQETWVQSLGWEEPLEKEMATHSSILVWRNPWTEEPGGLQSMGHKESNRTEQLPHILELLPEAELKPWFLTPLLVLLALKQAGIWDPWLQCLYLDKCFLNQQNTKKVYGTKNNFMHVQ